MNDERKNILSVLNRQKPDIISLSQKFFEGADIDIEVKAKVIYESDKDDIINQYIILYKVFNEQTKQHGMTQSAVTETIRICMDRNVLREYLAQREKEVVTIMMSLFDEEQILKSFIRSERHDTDRETAERMIKKAKTHLYITYLTNPYIQHSLTCFPASSLVIAYFSAHFSVMSS